MSDESLQTVPEENAKPDVDDIVAPLPPKGDELAKKEVKLFEGSGQSFENQAWAFVLNQLKTEGTGLEIDTKQRKLFAYLIYSLVCGWLVAVLVLVYLCGLKIASLDNSILIALITGGTVNVLSLLGTVIAYLFAKRGDAQWMAKAFVDKLTNKGKPSSPVGE